MKDMKPVAWIVSDGSSQFITTKEDELKNAIRFNWNVTPLYAIPDGCAVVPVEPTLPMLAELGFNGDMELSMGHANICDELRENYKAMLKAAQEEV